MKRVKCSADCSAIFVFTTLPHPQVLSVNGALTCNSNSQERSFSKTTNKQSQTKEIGRCNQTTKDNRHYPFCGSNIIEDEVLFLFRWPTFSMIMNNFNNSESQDSDFKYLTIIPKARMGSESIVHEAEGRMGFWFRGDESERNNCFSKIQLVGQKYRHKTT